MQKYTVKSKHSFTYPSTSTPEELLLKILLCDLGQKFSRNKTHIFLDWQNISSPLFVARWDSILYHFALPFLSVYLGSLSLLIHINLPPFQSLHSILLWAWIISSLLMGIQVSHFWHRYVTKHIWWINS